MMICIDDGSTGNKVAFKNGDSWTFKTISNRAELGRGVSDDGRSSTYSVDGKVFTFYEQCEALQTSNVHYQYSDHALLSVHHALHECGFSGQKVNISVTLPINQFFKDGRVNTANIEKKKQNLLREVEAEDKAPVKIMSVVVYPEGIPAVQPLICDSKGNSLVDSDELTFIADFGGTTLDLALFSGAAERIIRADSYDIGMLNCFDSIKLETGRSGLRDMQLQLLLETGQCAGGKVKVDRLSVSKPLMSKAATRIIDFLGKDLDSLSHAYLIGGGADLLALTLEGLGVNASVVPDSTLALVKAIAKIEQEKL